MADIFQYNDQTHELFIKRDNDYKPHPGGLGKFYFDRIQQIINEDESVIAQIDGKTGTTQTFKQLLDSSIKLAEYMQTSGIAPGDNITMCSYNHLNSTVVVLAAQFTGAVLSSTDPILSLTDTTYLLNMVKPKMVFVSEGSEDLIQKSLDANQLQPKLISVTNVSHETLETIDNILKNTKLNKDFEPFFATDLNLTCAILFSSGTTGMPKGICLPHNYFMAPLSIFPTAIMKWVLFNYASFYWISCVFNLGMSIQMGSARLLCRKFEKTTHWEVIAKYKVTYMILSNTFFMEALKNIPDNDQLPDLKVLVIGGGLVPKNDLIYYTNKLPKVQVGYLYALTEGGLVSQFKTGDKLASNGQPVAINQTIKIVDPNTEENLALNKVGEIRVKQPFQMIGYYKMDSSDAWDSQGYLKTGDLGYLDDEFHLFTVDRIKEMFKYRSWHIVPAKIENVLGNHPDVLYAVVIGKPTYNEDENHAMAIVCLQDGARVSAEELEAFVNQRLDAINQIRAGVKIIQKSEIEFTPTGKINRRLLKSKFVPQRL